MYGNTTTTTTITTTTTTTSTTTASVASYTKAEDIELKIRRNVEGKVQLNQNIIFANRLSKVRICNVFGTAYQIKLKLLEHHEGDVQPSNRHSVHTTIAINTAVTLLLLHYVHADCQKGVSQQFIRVSVIVGFTFCS